MNRAERCAAAEQAATIPDGAKTQASRPWVSAPIADQISELRRLQEGQRKYHAKVLAIGTNAKPTLYRLSDWRLASAIRTLESVRDAVDGTTPT